MTPSKPPSDFSSEPSADTPPVRRFISPGFQPLCATLAEVRIGIDRIDDQLVDLMAQRLRFVKEATRFKADPHQVSAPRRQAQVFERVSARASSHPLAEPGLPDLVDAVWRTMVAASITNEERWFGETEPVVSHDSRG